MMEDVMKYVPIQYVIYSLLVLAAVVLLCIKFVPLFIKWFNAARLKANSYENLSKSIEKNTKDIELINQKIGRDYARLNQIFQTTERQQQYIEESLEERELILKSLLGVIQGLQEIGANGPTKVAEAEIQAYLLKKSHDVDRERHTK